MIHFFREVRTLQEEGKLHTGLVTRVRMLFGISILLLAAVGYTIVFGSVDPRICVALGLVGFFLGLYIFSRMSVVTWDEQMEKLEMQRMDVLGYITLGLYIVFEISFRTVLHKYFPASATAYLLSGIFGTIFGRAVGTVVEIHRVFKTTH